MDRTRNRIRHQLLPLLARDYNPAVAAILCRLADQARETFAEEELAACALLALAELPRAGPLVVLGCAALASRPRHLVCAAFRLVWEREGWPAGRMSRAGWQRLAGLVFDGVRAVDLPEGISARRRGQVLTVGPGTGGH